MRRGFIQFLAGTALSLLAFLPVAHLGPAVAETDGAYVAPRGPGGVHPDLNGIWQALNEANYDIELHLARPSMQSREGPHGPVPSLETYKLGAVVSVPPGLGVVEGGKIPYTPEALEKKLENQADWINRDPEVKCYLPGVAARELHAAPVPDLPGRGHPVLRLPVLGRRAGHLHAGPRPRTHRQLDGPSPTPPGTATRS